MLNQRHPDLIEGRSLPQRNGQFNRHFSRIYISPHRIRKTGFDSRLIVADAFISGGELFHWSKKYLKKVHKLLGEYIFGFFVLGFSAFQVLPILPISVATKSAAEIQSQNSFRASVVASEAPIFQRPVKGAISQGFWYVHPAIDIPNPYGSRVKPIASGEVTLASWDGGYGYSVVIKHKAGFSSRYAHLSKILVKKGSKVTNETVIGLVGATGFATGAHLHLEVYNEGKVVNPLTYVPKN
ncbi:MAG: M23 family metallopeptidase [Candidatus Woykebacteria bacterium]